MVMGQEEKKNKARLEKAQGALTSSNSEYDSAIKALEKTTERWNRDWKAACDVCSTTCPPSLYHSTLTLGLAEIPRLGGRADRFLEVELLDVCQYLLYGLCQR